MRAVSAPAFFGLSLIFSFFCFIYLEQKRIDRTPETTGFGFNPLHFRELGLSLPFLFFFLCALLRIGHFEESR